VAAKPNNGVYALGFLGRFLETSGEGNVLSTPNLLTLDNEEARIVVGRNVPFVTGQFTSNNTNAGSVNPFQTIERKDVGLTLRVKPQISEDGNVKLQVYQEVSSVDPATVNSSNGPTTNKRSIETNVVVEDGAIVVLGGGVVVGLPGGDEQMSKTSLERLRLGAQLARQSVLPLVFSGGSGWGAKDDSVSEADVAEKVLQDAFGIKLNYKESSSRDTQENAGNTLALLSKQGIQRIALVTNSTHMPRASSEFKRVGFDVTEAAVGQPTVSSETLLGWFPGASNLELSQSVLRELLAKLIQKLKYH
jgi:uncharacterized SAM-binding protein YcdF (DUF218 family)